MKEEYQSISEELNDNNKDLNQNLNNNDSQEINSNDYHYYNPNSNHYQRNNGKVLTRSIGPSNKGFTSMLTLGGLLAVLGIIIIYLANRM